MPVKKKAKPVAVEAPEEKPRLPRDFTVDFLRQMLRIRRLEERSDQAYGQGKIGGFCHLYIGQEAVAVGALAALRDDDYVLTTYRDHGMALVRGISAEAIFAELFGRETGCSKGRGGSMHLFDRGIHFLGGHGIVGAHIPLGTGVAFATKYRGEDRVTLCVFGEGAVNNGGFHEAMNLAALWDLPIVYLCENNRYGMGTAIERASSIVDLHIKADAYGMAHALVDGMDVFAVHDAVQKAVDRARKGEPSFIELRTYRFRGHSMSDPIHSHYRTKEEVELERERDPIKRLSAWLQENGVTQDEIRSIDREVSAEIKEAMEAALAAAEPAPSTVYEYVYKVDPYREHREVPEVAGHDHAEPEAADPRDGERGSQSLKATNGAPRTDDGAPAGSRAR
jgi:pyruvate dehydrogenase E1 component alpha subunit